MTLGDLEQLALESGDRRSAWSRRVPVSRMSAAWMVSLAVHVAVAAVVATLGPMASVHESPRVEYAWGEQVLVIPNVGFVDVDAVRREGELAGRLSDVEGSGEDEAVAEEEAEGEVVEEVVERSVKPVEVVEPGDLSTSVDERVEKDERDAGGDAGVAAVLGEAVVELSDEAEGEEVVPLPVVEREDRSAELMESADRSLILDPDSGFDSQLHAGEEEEGEEVGLVAAAVEGVAERSEEKGVAVKAEVFEVAAEVVRRGVDRGVLQLDRPVPVYPQESLRGGEEGLVVLEVEVRADGRVGAIRVLREPGYRRLVDAAIDAARRTRFEPAMEDGRTVDSRVELPYRFRIRRGG